MVDNRPGASGNLGTDAVAKAAPDGTTIGISILGPLGLNTLLFAKMPYDPFTDLALVTRLTDMPSVLAVNADVPARTTAELVALLKREPGKFNYGSIGNGSLSHLAMEAIALKSGTQLVHIPYGSLAAGGDRADPRRRADRLPAGGLGDVAGSDRQGQGARGHLAEALAAAAGDSDAERRPASTSKPMPGTG